MYHDFTRVIADSEVVSSIPVQSHTFVEIDDNIFSSVILLLPLIQEGCHLQVKLCARSIGKPLSQACSRKSMVWLTNRLDMTTAVDWDVKTKTI